MSYLIALLFVVLVPLLLSLWTALKKQRSINQYYSDKTSEMNTEISKMQKTIEDYRDEINQVNGNNRDK